MAELSPWYTGDATARTYQPDFSPLVMAPPLPGGDISVYPVLGKLIDGTEPTKFEWVEEPLNTITVTGTEGSGDGWNSTTDTTWDFTSGQCAAAGLRIGALLRDITDTTKDEIVKVTAISSDQVTVVRDYGGFVSGSGGGTTGEAHALTTIFEVVNHLNFEGSVVSTSSNKTYRDRSLAYNYYSILSEELQVTASDLVRVYRGSTPDNWAYQMNGLQQKIQRQLERTIILSPQKARASGEEGSMGGLLWYATQTSGASGYSYDTTSEAFSYEVFDDGMLRLYNQGVLDGSHDIVCIMPPAGAQYAAYIHESALRGEYISETVRGLQCTTLMSTITGDRIPIIKSAAMPSDSFMLLNLNAVRVHFAVGRALTIYSHDVGEGATLPDYRAARPICELTLEFQRPLDNCFYHTGVTYARPV